VGDSRIPFTFLINPDWVWISVNFRPASLSEERTEHLPKRLTLIRLPCRKYGIKSMDCNVVRSLREAVLMMEEARTRRRRVVCLYYVVGNHGKH